MTLQEIEQALCECSGSRQHNRDNQPASRPSILLSTDLGKRIARWKHDRVRLKDQINPLRTLALAVEAGIVTDFQIEGTASPGHEVGKRFEKEINGAIGHCKIISKVSNYLYEVEVSLSQTSYRVVLGHLEIQ